MENIRAIIVDDHKLWRDSFSTYLKMILPCVSIVGKAGDGADLLDQLINTKVDIVFLDISMPKGMGGMETLKIIREKHPDLKVIMLSMHEDKGTIDLFLEKGAHAYLTKDSSDEILIKITLNVFNNIDCLEGSKELADKLSAELMDAFCKKHDLKLNDATVLRLLCKGASNRVISLDLKISERTVGRRVTNIYLKTGVKSKADMIAFGIKHGLA